MNFEKNDFFEIEVFRESSKFVTKPKILVLWDFNPNKV